MGARRAKVGAVVCIVDRAVTELGLDIELAQLVDLLQPPIGLFEFVGCFRTASEDDVLGVEFDLGRAIGIEHPVGEHEAARGEHGAHVVRSVFEAFAQVTDDFRIGRGRDADGIFTAIAGFQPDVVSGSIVLGHITCDEV